MSEIPKIETQLPTDEQATEFAVMIQSGLPASHAILYFVEAATPDAVDAWSRRWLGSRAVNAAITKLMRKSWQAMTTQEQMDYSLDLHYRQLATMLMSHNYLEASAMEKSKMDDARKAMEAKNAGLAGAQGGLEMFYADLRAGKVVLNSQRAIVKPPVVN